jgi:fumarate reductase subunit D
MEPQNQDLTPVPPAASAPVSAPVSVSGPSHSTGMAILAYLGILVLVPLLVSKNDEFVKFHVKQGLVLFIAWIAIYGFSMMSFIGGMIYWLLTMALWILIVVGIINAATGKQAKLPVIGRFSDYLSF